MTNETDSTGQWRKADKSDNIQRSTIRAALFDMDGVLYDSMPYHAKAWVACMHDCGLKMTEEEAFLYEGMRGVEVIKMKTRAQLGRDISDEEAEEVYRLKSERYSSFPKANIIPGVKDLQTAMKAKGWTIGVVTGSGQPSLIDRIKHDFDGLITPGVIVTAHDVRHGKPLPDPYIMCMKKAGTLPSETVVIENAPLGVRSAIAAGCHCIAVNTGPLPDEALKREGADAVVKSMYDAMEIIKTL